MKKLMDLASSSTNAMSPEEKLSAAIALHRTEHFLYPPFFQRVNDLPELAWQKLKFEPGSRQFIPKQQGVYAFAIDLSSTNLPSTSYILYVGKAGDLASSNTLHNRFYDYQRTELVGDRPRVREMLRQWKGFLSYHYAVVE